MSDYPHRRSVSWGDPSRLAKLSTTMSGLKYLRGMRDGTIDHPPISLMLDFRVVEVEKGRVVFAMTPDEYHLNPFGAVHGGVISGVIDAATGCAVHSTLAAGVGYTSIDVKVNYLRPVTIATGTVRCEGLVVHAGKRLAIAEARMIDTEGRLCAFGTSTIMVFR